MKYQRRGFTLIELLVVVAIIGVLSTVVLASLNSARDRARVAGIKANVLSFGKIMELEYGDTGSYANLNKSWVGTITPCASRGYAGSYASKAIEICEKLSSLITNHTPNDIHTGVPTPSFSNANNYSIMVRLPSTFFFCLGSSGRTSELGNGGDGWVAPGCYGNP